MPTHTKKEGVSVLMHFSTWNHLGSLAQILADKAEALKYIC